MWSSKYFTHTGTMTPRCSVFSLIKGDAAAWIAIWSGRNSWDATPVRLLTCVYYLLLYPGVRATALYRIAHALHEQRVRVLPQLVTQLNAFLHGLEIPCTVSIGPRLYIPHPYGTVVTAARIGSDLTLVSNVTIGMRTERIFPTIGDRVFIGAGARVLGAIHLGNDVNVGANAVVLKDVPDGSVAVGVPAQVRPGRS